MSHPRIPGDVIIVPARQGRWVAANVFARTALAMESDGLAAMRAEEGPATLSGDARYRVWHVQRFAQATGLLADPTWFVRDDQPWPEPELVDRMQLMERCRKSFVLVDDPVAYRRRFAQKTSLLDHSHFGNLHQQLGCELLVKQRVRPESWWVRQKFADGGDYLRENLYRAVQAWNLDRYFSDTLRRGMTVLDVGCGTGFYSRRMSACGAEVIGLDPNPDHIAAADARGGDKVRFAVADIGRPGALDSVTPGSIDLTFISDALLLYFVPPVAGMAASLDTLLADVRRVLKPSGVFTIVEPHYAFFQTPWLGDVDRPFTVISEYTHRTFGITGTIAALFAAMTRHGFAAQCMQEWTPDPAFEAIDARAYHFACEFPLWHLWEFIPGPSR